MPQSDWPTAQAQRDIILQDFDPANPAIGDRRQARLMFGLLIAQLVVYVSLLASKGEVWVEVM